MSNQDLNPKSEEFLTVNRRPGKGSVFYLEMTLKTTAKQFELPDILARIGVFPSLEDYFHQGLLELRARLMKDADEAVTRMKANGPGAHGEEIRNA